MTLPMPKKCSEMHATDATRDVIGVLGCITAGEKPTTLRGNYCQVSM